MSATLVAVVDAQRIPPEDTPIAALVRPFQNFAGRETSGGIVLLTCTLVALV